METSIVIAGFGGQGVLFAGQLLAYAGMDTGQHVTWIPSYGPEMRGGTANCTVIISEDPIGSPIVSRPDVAIVLNEPSYEKYVDVVKPGGLLVVNSSLVISVCGNTIAQEVGNIKLLNMAVLGALLARRPVLTLPQLEQAIRTHVSERKAHLAETNLEVLRRGFATQAPVMA